MIKCKRCGRINHGLVTVCPECDATPELSERECADMLREAEEAVGLIRREAKQTELIRAIRSRFKDVPLCDADREALELGLTQLSGIWEDEDGI